MWAHWEPPGWGISQNEKAERYSHSQAHDAGIQSTWGNTVNKKKEINVPKDASGAQGN